MPQSYTPEFKKKIVRLHEEEGRTYKSITAEYSVSKASISKWCHEFSEECQTSPETKEEYDYIVIRQIRRCLLRQIKTGLTEHLTMV